MPTFRNTLFHLHRLLCRWNEQFVPKRRHIKLRRRGINQKKAYNIQNMAKVQNQSFCYMHVMMLFSWKIFENLYYLQTLIPKWHCYTRWKLRILSYMPRCCLGEGKPWHRNDWNWRNITSDNFVCGVWTLRPPSAIWQNKKVYVHFMKACWGCGGKSPNIHKHGWWETLRLPLSFVQTESLLHTVCYWWNQETLLPVGHSFRLIKPEPVQVMVVTRPSHYHLRQ